MRIRATGTFANPNLLGACLVLLLPFALLAAVPVDERTARTAIVVMVVGGYGALVTTFSRAGYVAGAAGLLVLGVAYWLAPRLADRAQRRLYAVVGGLGLLGAAGVIWAVSRAGDSLGVRGQAWRAALQVARRNPLGVGLGRSGEAISAAAPGDRVFVHAHNLWLNWLVETGPPRADRDRRGDRRGLGERGAGRPRQVRARYVRTRLADRLLPRRHAGRPGQPGPDQHAVLAGAGCGDGRGAGRVAAPPGGGAGRRHHRPHPGPASRHSPQSVAARTRTRPV
ncbi:O-antigen ligase family protein [Streptomyces sp. NPDC048254]|uniref:O-antigen ligase family protein n=1 Tax=Streptomyces sp. NPDC048254 TaxID=3365525 RepID=UPI00371EAC8E